MTRSTLRRSGFGGIAVVAAGAMAMGLVALGSADASPLPASTSAVASRAFVSDAAVKSAVRSAGFTGTKLRKVRRAIAPSVVKKDDATLAYGRTRVTFAGEAGVLRITLRDTYRDGVLITSHRVNTRVALAAKPKIVHVGTKGAPASRGFGRVPPGVNATVFAAAMAWAKTSAVKKIRQCEASGDYSLQDSPYYGAYQFLTSTWRSMGGGQFASRADLAPSWAQDYVAYKLYRSQGWSPWTCASITGVA